MQALAASCPASFELPIQSAVVSVSDQAFHSEAVPCSLIMGSSRAHATMIVTLAWNDAVNDNPVTQQLKHVKHLPSTLHGGKHNIV